MLVSDTHGSKDLLRLGDETQRPVPIETQSDRRSCKLQTQKAETGELRVAGGRKVGLSLRSGPSLHPVCLSLDLTLTLRLNGDQTPLEHHPGVLLLLHHRAGGAAPSRLLLHPARVSVGVEPCVLLPPRPPHRVGFGLSSFFPDHPHTHLSLHHLLTGCACRTLEAL